ncbi:MAG: signal peptidase I [Alphaproteobacteria bacterium]|nr:MAG: signal peptidase I [Alphaproteobacteria bacterium]
MTSKRESRSGIIGAVGQLVTVILMVLLIKTVAAEAYYVPSGSMLPSLLIGDQLLVSKFPYGYSRYSLPLPLAPATPKRLLGSLPERGDVVVFRLPRDPGQTYVKRVIGLPGDRVQMRGARLWVNGAMLPLRRDGVAGVEGEDGMRQSAPRYIETLPNGRQHAIFKFRNDGDLDDTEIFTVAPGQIFVMGDNRDDSVDSRVPARAGGVGFVPVENLVGRVEAVLGSWDPEVRREPVWNWPSGLRLSRFFSRVK